MTKKKKAPRPRKMNPLTFLRAQTFKDKKKEASREACRKRPEIDT